MDICVLTTEEVGRLRNYELKPCCEEHVHIAFDEAIQGIIEDTFELIIDTDGRQYVYKSKLYFIRPKLSAGVAVIQRVVSNQLLELKPIR